MENDEMSLACAPGHQTGHHPTVHRAAASLAETRCTCEGWQAISWTADTVSERTQQMWYCHVLLFDVTRLLHEHAVHLGREADEGSQEYRT